MNSAPLDPDRFFNCSRNGPQLSDCFDDNLQNPQGRLRPSISHQGMQVPLIVGTSGIAAPMDCYRLPLGRNKPCLSIRELLSLELTPQSLTSDPQELNPHRKVAPCSSTGLYALTHFRPTAILKRVDGSQSSRRPSPAPRPPNSTYRQETRQVLRESPQHQVPANRVHHYRMTTSFRPGLALALGQLLSRTW